MAGDIQSLFIERNRLSREVIDAPSLKLFNRHLDNVFNTIQKDTLNLKLNLRSKGMLYQKCYSALCHRALDN